ncbi:hypothetical protein L7F22_059805 [Adiantum nelumboides]|nr:hypothetical protein [Adiantum nelumboides]
MEHLRAVFEMLRKERLVVNGKKSDFFMEEIHFLGHIVLKDGVRMDPAKIKAIQDWPEPVSLHEIDGQSEIVNSAVLGLLKCYVSDNPAQWEHYLPLVEFAYNNTIHSSTGKAPFEIVEGARKPPPMVKVMDDAFEADKFVEYLDLPYQQVQQAIQKAQEKQKKAADKHRRRLHFREGDWISEVINDVSYRLSLPASWKIHNAFHVSLLRQFVGELPDQPEDSPQPEVDELDEVLQPEQTLAHKERRQGGRVVRRYLVKFKNYSAMDSKWMEEVDLADTPQILELYLEAFSLQPTIIGAQTGIRPVLALASKGFWNNTQTFVVKGKMAVLEVVMMDAYGNMLNASVTPLLFSMYFLFSNGTRFSQPYTQISDRQSGHAIIQIMVTMDLGSWPCHVFYNASEIGGSPFRYTVLSGNNYTNVFVQWTNNVSTFEAGKRIQEDVEFRDPIMNLLDVKKLKYSLSFHLDNPADATNCFNVSSYPASRYGFVELSQLCLLVGTFHGYVLMNSTKVANDLSSFRIIPGPVFIPNCLGSFPTNQSSYQAGEMITFDVLLRDAYNNIVSKANGRVDEFNFTYQFVEIDTNITVTPKNLSRISRKGVGHEIINFTLTLPGNYSLYVGGSQPASTIFWRSRNGQLGFTLMASHQAQVQDAPFDLEITTGNLQLLLDLSRMYTCTHARTHAQCLLDCFLL